MHHGLHKWCVCIFGLHELHLSILVHVSTHVFLTHFTCFIDVHSGLAYTQGIHSYIVNKICACILTTIPWRAYVPFDLVMLTVTLSNKFYSELRRYTDDHMYSNTLVHLERRFFVKQYSYCSQSVIPIWLAYLSVTSLLVSCISSVP